MRYDAPVRRRWPIFLLIPAAFAASIGLATYSYRRSRGERQLMMEMLAELAEEKVLGVESEIIKSERLVFEAVDFGKRYELEDILAKAPFVTAFILDYDQNIVPTGTYSKLPLEETKELRELLESEVLPKLGLDELQLGQRSHHHGTYLGRPVLFSYMRGFSGGQFYFLVLQVDLSYLVGTVFPQFFGVRSKQLYQVVDREGNVIYGYPFTNVPASAIAQLEFPNTLSNWSLRVTQRDRLSLADYEARQLVDAALIGAALLVIVGGLAVLLYGIRRERRLNQLKSDFISNVSHELKTPLSIISMFGELLASGRTRSDQQATEYAEIIQRESVRLGRLIDNVLDFAKIERGANAYEFAPGNLSEVVERALEISKHRLANENLELEVELPAAPLPAEMDSNAMVLAVLNLVDNAIKYASEGGRLKITAAERDRGVEVLVRDWGPGIEADEHAAIFDRFYRAKSIRLKPIRGSGIGLALVKHIVDAHRGTVTVESAPGAGSTFRIWIPRGGAE